MPKPHPREFRDDVVAVARKGAAPIAQLAKDFGISESCLRNWPHSRIGCAMGCSHRTVARSPVTPQPGHVFDQYGAGSERSNESDRVIHQIVARIVALNAAFCERGESLTRGARLQQRQLARLQF